MSKKHHQVFCPSCGHRARYIQVKTPKRGCPYTTCDRFKQTLTVYSHTEKKAWVWPCNPRAPNGTGRMWT